MTKHLRAQFLAEKRAAELDHHVLVTLCQSCRYYSPGLGQTYYDGYDPPECLHPLAIVQERNFDRAQDGSLSADGCGGDCWAFRPRQLTSDANTSRAFEGKANA